MPACRAQRGGCQLSCPSLCLIPLRPGLSEDLDQGWQPVSSRNLLPIPLGSRSACVQLLTQVAGVQTQGLTAGLLSYPLSHFSGPENSLLKVPPIILGRKLYSTTIKSKILKLCVSIFCGSLLSLCPTLSMCSCVFVSEAGLKSHRLPPKSLCSWGCL